MIAKIKLCAVNILFMVICILPMCAEAEIIEADGMATLSGDLKVAQEMAYQDALKNAANQAGVYVETESIAQNFKLTKDEIRMVSAEVFKVIGMPDYTFETERTNKKAVQDICHIKAEVDTSNIKSILQDKKRLNQNKNMAKELEAAKQEIARLKSNAVNREEVEKQYLIKAYEKNLFNAFNNKSDELTKHYITEIRKLDPANNVAHYVFNIQTKDKQQVINDALNILKVDPNNFVACSTLARYEKDKNLLSKYCKQGIKAVRKKYTPEQIKRMCLTITVNFGILIYPSNVDNTDYVVWDSVWNLYNSYFGANVESITNIENYVPAPMKPAEVEKFFAKYKKEYNLNYDEDFIKMFDINDVKDIIIASGYSDKEI